MMMCGGFTPEAEAATAEHQELADGVKAAVEAKTNQTFAMFKVINYKSQVVAGTNFLMKVQVSEAADGFIHIKIFRPLPHTRQPAELHEHSDIVLGKTLEDPIEI